MAKSRKKKKPAVRLTGVEDVIPKLAGLRATVKQFRTDMKESGLGSLDISGLIKDGGLAAPFVSAIKSAAAFHEQVQAVNTATGSTVLPTVPQVAAQNLKDFSASMNKVSLAFGTALLPAVSAVTVKLDPLLGKLAQVMTDNPNLVEGLTAGAVALAAVQVAVAGVSGALAFMNLVMAANPVVLFAIGFVTAAALVVAYWTPITAFFADLWDGLEAAAMPIVAFFQGLFGDSPLDPIARVWEPVVAWFSSLWERLKAVVEPIKQLLSGAVGGLIGTFMGGDVRVTPQIAGVGGEQAAGLLSPVAVSRASTTLVSNVGGIASTEVASNAHLLLQQGAVDNRVQGDAGAEPRPWLLPPAAVSLVSTQRVSNVGGSTSTQLASSSTSLLQQTAANNRTQLNGDLRVSFDNAPAGLRVSQPQTNQPGLSVTPRVGYRSLSLGGAHELA
ncbi:hypothetical protein ACW9H6_04080 [Pseudomonas sp. SDO528_S397]